MRAPFLLLLVVALAVGAPCQGQALAPGADSTVGATSSDASTSPATSETSAPALPASLPPLDPNYLLQPDDVIEVIVFREPDLTTNAIVRKDGRFEMKLLGPVQVAGLSLDQATEAIRAGLAEDYLVSPRVNLSIVSYAKKKVNVLGEVRTPGLYGYPEHGTLMLSDAIAMAGGLLPTADAAHVTVRREVGDKSEVTQVDASGGDGQANTCEVQPDDAITVAVLAKRHFTVLGQINRPGDYDVADNRPIYLTDAIALAGGFTRLANPTHVLLKRSEAGTRPSRWSTPRPWPTARPRNACVSRTRTPSPCRKACSRHRANHPPCTHPAIPCSGPAPRPRRLSGPRTSRMWRTSSACCWKNSGSSCSWPSPGFSSPTVISRGRRRSTRPSGSLQVVRRRCRSAPTGWSMPSRT